MTNQLRFDGPSLEDVLVRVRDEIGEHAVIVEANRSLKGGVAGFFSKEWFEVVVELGQVETAPANHENDLLAWAERVQDEEEFASVLATLEVPVQEKVPAKLALLDMLEELEAIVPSPFQPAPGPAVMVFVGELTGALRSAGAFAKRIGQSTSDVVVASQANQPDLPAWMIIDSKAGARQRAARWRLGAGPIVVAVDLIPGLEGHTWASEIIDALGANHVRLVAKAWQVTSELAAKATMIGGVDGLELIELAESATPEEFLNLGFPVWGLDGRVATAELWAALLMERRADEKR